KRPRRSRSGTAGHHQPRDQWHRGDDAGHGPGARARDPLAASRRKPGTRDRGGLRCRDRGRQCGSALRCVLHHQAGWHGHGAIDQPLDHPSAWWAAVGDREPGARHHVSLQPAGDGDEHRSRQNRPPERTRNTHTPDSWVNSGKRGGSAAATCLRLSSTFRPPGGSVYRSCCRAWRRVGFSPYLSIFRESVLFEIRRSLATIVRLPWRRAIAVRMASRSTASRSRTAADSAETPGSRPVAATERAISSGSAAAVTVSSLVNITMPSTTCRISRTFPGHGLDAQERGDPPTLLLTLGFDERVVDRR